MPRSVSGNYTLPLPPVVPNTVIQSAWANTTLDDVAQALTNSLDRYGNGGMVGPFRLVDGAEATPALAFAAETGTGLWRDGTGVLAFSVLGAKVGQWSAAGLLAADITTLNLTATNFLTSVVDADDIIVSGTAHVSGSVLFDSTLEVVGDTYMHGRLGVGLTPTTIKLHVSDSQAGVARLNSTAGSGTYLGVANNTSLQARFGVGSAVVTGAAAGDLGIRAENTGNILFSASGSGTEHMRLDTGGNLGIGVTPSGTYKLQLTTTATNMARFDSTNASGGFVNISLANVSRARIGCGPTVIVGGGLNDLALRSDSGAILFSANGSAEHMRLDLSGRLGVGRTPTAGYIVDAQGTIRAVGDGNGLRVINTVGDGAGSFTAPAGAAGGVDISADAGGMRFYAAGSARMTLAPSTGWLSLGMGTTAAEQRNFQIRDSSGAQIILGNRTNTASVIKFGAILFDAYRDVASPSIVAGMWAEGTAPLGNAGDLVFGAQANGGAGTYPTERMRLYSNGQARIGLTTGAVTASALEVKGASNTLILSGGATDGYQGMRIYNDIYSASRSLEIDYYGSTFAGTVGWGPAGEQASIVTTGAYPLVLGASNNSRLWIQADGGQPIRASSNANWHNLTLDPGTSSAAIPIGAVVCAEAAGLGAGLAPLATVALGGAITLTLYGFAPAGNTVLNTGTYRLVSRVSANFAHWMKTG